MHSGGILPSEQMIALISTHNSITTKHYANGKHEPAGETSEAKAHSPLGRGDHEVVGEVSGKVLRGLERALFFTTRGYDLIHRKRSPFPSSGEGIIKTTLPFR